MSPLKKPRLSVTLLGAPSVLRDGEAVDLASRRAQALLFRLAVTGQREDRDALADLLFPRLDRERARAGLRQALSLLASAIGHEWLAADRNGIQLPDAPGLFVDVRSLRLLPPRPDLEQLRVAVALFRGELLQGFSLRDSPEFEDWQLSERERLAAQRSALLCRLAEALQAQGDHEGAARHARERAALDPLDEEAARGLMLVLARAGRAPEALRAHERHSEALKRELGVDPDGKTRALRESIAAGEVAVVAVAAPAAERPATGRGNLPSPPNAFIGRAMEVEAVVQALRRPDVRLLTLTGAGGIGKTRLALESAAKLRSEFPDGIFLVDLGPLQDAAGVTRLIATTIGVLGSAGDERPVAELLGAQLRESRLLLVMDNFEHLLEGAAHVGSLLAACAKVKVLATSREALRLQAEHEYEVPPLGLEGGATGKGDAAELFSVRAAAARGSRPLDDGEHAVAREVCARLDGLPLAIELAAAKTRTYSVGKLLGHLQDGLGFLTGGARDLPHRQRTLRSEIDWSYRLLSPLEQELLAQCSVFAGSFSPEAASAVAACEAHPGLFSLVEKSLLRTRAGEPQRFEMLQTIHDFAAEKLREGTGSEAGAAAAATRYFTELAERADARIRGPDFRQWLDLLDEELPNLRGLLEWCAGEGHAAEGLRLAAALGWFWFRRAHFAEGDRWLELFLESAGEAASPGDRARGLYYLSWVRRMTSDKHEHNPDVNALCAESAALAAGAGERTVCALALACGSARISRLVADGSIDVVDPGRPENAARAIAMAREAGDPWATAMCIAQVTGEYRQEERMDLDPQEADALRLAEESRDPFLVSFVTSAQASHFGGTSSVRAAEKAAAAAEAAGDVWCRISAMHLRGAGLMSSGQTSEADAVLKEVLRLSIETGARGWVHWAIGGLDWSARAQGRMKRALRLMAAAVHFVAATNHPEDDPRMLVAFKMSREELDREWAAGWSMTFDKAIAYALSDED